MGSPTAWTGNPNPLTHEHRAERVQNQRRGGADLCVRSAGCSSEDTRTAGQPIRVDRKSQSAHTQTSRGKGPEPAPRGGGPLCPLRWAFIRGHSHRRAGNRRGPEIQCAHTQTSRGKGPEPASRGGGPLCPLRWAFIRRQPHRRAGNPRRPKIPIRSHTDIPRKGSRTSAVGGRTSVSAPLGVHPRTAAPMGNELVWNGNAGL
jgi:hypothetical protein